MKEHVMRLLPGEDLLQGIDTFCKKNAIGSGYIATCVGSLTRISFRKGYTKQPATFEGPFEIVSCEGTVSKGGHHIHTAVSDADYRVIGGHITLGCIVKSTAEVVIIELETYEINRSKGRLSGYKELEVNPQGHVCKNQT